MDAQAKKKAMFRSKLNAEKKDTRIDSTLVRYNEPDQPVCRVCNIVLKSESLWDVHQASRKHHEAINNLKASAAGIQRSSKPVETQPSKTETLAKSSKSQSSAGLPPNFFENPEESTKSKNEQQSKQIIGSETNKTKGPLPAGFFDNQNTDSSNNNKTTSEPKQSQTQTTGGSETKLVVKGNLRTGFFDNKEADLLARGIKLVKPDIKDEYREFEKLIQEDLQLVDSRMEEEEEILAAIAPIVEPPPPPPQNVGVADAAAEVVLPQQQNIARARDAAVLNYATLICGPASTMPLTRCTYPDISTFIPNFTTTFYYLNSMDHLMTATKRWTDNCLGWVPPFSQVYIGMLCYIQTMRAMQAAGLLTPTSEISILLGEFTSRFPLQNLWIPGPLVYLFKSIACFKPSDIFGNVSPTLPTSPGWSRARRFRINDAASSHLPNINIFISRINSVCAAASRLNATNYSFLRDVDGPRFMANLFAQPCNNDANEQANLISPGSSLAYSGNLKLWQDASSQLLFVNPPALLDVGSDDVTDNWTSFLGLSSNSNWFGSVTAMMVKYCQFWKGSVPLYDCSPASSAAGSVRCIAIKTDIYTPPVWNAQRGNHTSFSHDDANQSSHYTMRPSFHLTFQAATSLEDIHLAHYYSALTYNINMVRSVDDLAAVTHGPFWDIFPDSLVRSGIQIYPGINASLARDYHSETRIESERQNVR